VERTIDLKGRLLSGVFPLSVLALVLMAGLLTSGCGGCGNAGNAARWVEQQARENGENLVCIGAYQPSDRFLLPADQGIGDPHAFDWWVTCWQKESLLSSVVNVAAKNRSEAIRGAESTPRDHLLPVDIRCRDATQLEDSSWDVTCYELTESQREAISLGDLSDSVFRAAPCRAGH
jgi:hypothetical protein